MDSSGILYALSSNIAMGAILGLIPGFVAKKKGRNFWGYYFGSFIINPILMWLIVSCLSNLNDKPDKTSIDNEPLPKFKCQDCGYVFENFSDCPNCGSHSVKFIGYPQNNVSEISKNYTPKISTEEKKPEQYECCDCGYKGTYFESCPHCCSNNIKKVNER